MYPPKIEELRVEVARGNVREYKHDTLPLIGFKYSVQCELENAWNKVNKWARGIVFDHAGNLVALSFPKFFNLGQTHETLMCNLPNEPFETFIKEDGSLILLYKYQGQFITSTTGSFHSEQANWAIDWLRANKQEFLDKMPDNTTYLFEGIYPENRIVVDYGKLETLKFITAYDIVGKYEIINDPRTSLVMSHFPSVVSVGFPDMESIIKNAAELNGMEQEGYVVRYWNGLRVKVKGLDYLRIHRIRSYASPLNVWDALDILRDINVIPSVRANYWEGIPDEFREQLKNYERILKAKYKEILDAAQFELMCARINNKSRKDIYKHIRDNHKGDFISICMYLLDNNLVKADKAIKQKIRPTGNNLE